MMKGEKTSVSEDALYLGLEEGVSKRWTGIWNGMVEWKMENGMKQSMYTVTSNLCSWHRSFRVEPPSHRRSCMSRSSVAGVLLAW